MIGFLEKRKHNRLRELLSSYVDSQTSAPETREVEEHLAGCEECLVELETLKATTSLLSLLPQMDLPRSFVLSEAPAPVRGTPNLVWTTRFATSIAGLLLVALLITDVFGLVSQSDFAATPIEAPSAFQSSDEAFAPAVPAPAAPAPAAPAPAPQTRNFAASAPAAPAAPAPAAPSTRALAPDSSSLATETQAIQESAPVAAMAAPAPEAPAAPAPAASAPAPSAIEGDSATDATATVEMGRAVLSGEPSATETPTPMPTSTPSPTPSATPEPTSTPVPTLTATPESIAKAIVPTFRPVSEPGIEPREPESGTSLPLRQLQIALAVVFVALLVLTIWTARRRLS